MHSYWEVNFTYTRTVVPSLHGGLFSASVVCYDWLAAEDLLRKLQRYGAEPKRYPVRGDKGVLMVHGKGVPFGCVFGAHIRQKESKDPTVEFEQDSCLESELVSLVLR